jgi:hypothetical protein
MRKSLASQDHPEQFAKSNRELELVKMRSEMVRLRAATWRLWFALGLGVVGSVGVALSIHNTKVIFLAVSVLIIFFGVVQFSLWSKVRRSWL